MAQGNSLTFNRRNLLTAVSAAAALPVLGAAKADVLPAPASTARDLKPFKLLLDWYLNPNHVPVIVAEKMGAFASRGLKVEIIEPADPNDPPKLVAAGQADAAISYQPQLTMQVDQGLPLLRTGVLIDMPLNMLLALGDKGINTIADLKGRKIGNSVGGFEDALLSTMLGTAGLTLKDVEIVNVNFALAQSLMAGTVDAVIGAYRNYELNILAGEGKSAKPFFVEAHGVPFYDELIFVAHKDHAASAEMRAMMDAIQEAVGFTVNAPDKAWQMFIESKPQLDDALNRKAFADTLPRFAHVTRAADVARYAAFSDYLKKMGLISTARPGADYLVPA